MTRRKSRGSSGAGRRAFFVLLAVLLGVAGYWTCGRRRAPEAPPPVPAKTPTPAAARPEARPKDVPADFEPASGGTRGVVAVVIDDVGWDDTALAALADLHAPLALSVLPGTPRAAEAIALAKTKGWDLMLHLPMEPEAGKAEKETILLADDDATIRARVAAALAKVPGAIGLNNHQGSKATADARVLRAVLSVVKERGLFFLDSRTTAASQGESAAHALGVPFLARDVFLDDAAAEAKEAAGSSVALDAAWEKAVALAKAKGQAVIIGHPHRESVVFLAERLPALGKQGLRAVRVSELVP